MVDDDGPGGTADRIEGGRGAREERKRRQEEADEEDSDDSEVVEFERAPRPEGASTEEKQQLTEEEGEPTQEEEIAGEIRGDVIQESASATEADGSPIRARDVEVRKSDLSEREKRKLREEAAERYDTSPDNIEFESEPQQYEADLTREGRERLREAVRDENQTEVDAEEPGGIETGDAPLRESVQPQEQPDRVEAAKSIAKLPLYPVEQGIRGERRLQEKGEELGIPDSTEPLLGSSAAVGTRAATGAKYARYAAGGIGSLALGSGVALYGASEDLNEYQASAGVSTFDESEVDTPTDADFGTNELGVSESTQYQGEIAVGSETGLFPESDVEVSQEQFTDEVGVEDPMVEEELGIGSDSGETRQTGGETGTFVPEEYPTAGRDFPADPSREYVSGERPNVGLNTAEQIGVGTGVGEQVRDPIERRREERRQRQEYKDIIQGPEGSVMIGEEERGFSDFGYEPFVFPGPEVSTEDAAETDLQSAQETSSTTTATQTAGTGTVSEPILGAATDTELGLGQSQAQEQQTETATEVAQVTENAMANEFAYPTQQEYGYGYPNVTAEATSQGTPTPNIDPPLFGGDDSDDEDRMLFGAAEPVYSEFADPFTGTRETGDEFGVSGTDDDYQDSILDPL